MRPYPSWSVDGAEERIGEYWDWLAVVLFLLVSVDLLTTLFAARTRGVDAEANPLMQWALERGLGTLLVVNLGAVVLVVVLFYGLVEMVRVAPERVRPYFALLVELWIGALLAAGLVVFANNLAVVLLCESLL